MADEISNKPLIPLRTLEQDFFLATLVAIVEKQGISFSISLQCSGLVVSGTLVSKKVFFDRFAEDFAGAWPRGSDGDDNGADSLREGLAKAGRLRDGGDDSPRYVHLENAFIHVPGSSSPLPSKNGIHWRGRLSEITAFWLGAINVSS